MKNILDTSILVAFCVSAAPALAAAGSSEESWGGSIVAGLALILVLVGKRISG